MKLYKISQDACSGYDTYDSAVVSAESEADARTIHPCNYGKHSPTGYDWLKDENIDDWVASRDLDKIKVEYLGETEVKRGVIVSSFNAG